jgi:hypothetical protein
MNKELKWHIWSMKKVLKEKNVGKKLKDMDVEELNSYLKKWEKKRELCTVGSKNYQYACSRIRKAKKYISSAMKEVCRD